MSSYSGETDGYRTGPLILILTVKIALTTKSYFPVQGGSVVYARMLASAFTELGHEVRLVTRTSGPDDPSGSFPVIRKPSRGVLNEIASWSDILLQVDSSFRDGIPFLLRGRPWFPTIHRGRPSYSRLGMGGKIRLLAEDIAFRTGKSIGVSNFAAASWGADNVIPNPYDETVFHPAPDHVPKDIDILFVGRVTRDKGVFVLVDAVRKLRSTQPLRLAFVGGGVDLEELKSVVSETLPNINVEFPGQQELSDVADWMRKSRILAFPTTPDWLEASPLTPLEAAACGCIVVAADIGGTVENLPPGHHVIASGSVESLSEGLAAALAQNPAGIAAGTRKFLKCRTREVAAQAYLSLFEKSLS